MNFSNISKKKQIALILIAVSGIVAFLGYGIWKDFIKEDEAVSETTASVETGHIPDAETIDPNTSKIDAYKKTNTDRLWDDLADEDLYEDAEKPSSSGGGAGYSADILSDSQSSSSSSSSSSTSASSGNAYHDIVSSSSGGGSASKAPGSSGYREQVMNDYYDKVSRLGNQSNDAAQESSAQQQETPAAEPAQPERMAVQESSLRRTSAISSLDGGSGSGFSSLSDSDDLISSDDEYPFQCMFVRAEKLRSGSRVAVRLLEDLAVGNMVIPKNTHLQAICTISERLELKIASIEMNSKIYSLSYEAFDSDGYKGIYCPDLKKEDRQQATSRGLNLFNSAITSRIGRMASDVVNTGVSIAQNKTGEITVSVPAGYRFFIVKSKQK